MFKFIVPTFEESEKYVSLESFFSFRPNLQKLKRMEIDPEIFGLPSELLLDKNGDGIASRLISSMFQYANYLSVANFPHPHLFQFQLKISIFGHIFFSYVSTCIRFESLKFIVHQFF